MTMTTTVRSFLMVAMIGLAAPAFAADQVIRLAECQTMETEYLHDLAMYALVNRRYNIEEDTQTMLVGEQNGLKVELLIKPGEMVIRWKEGFGHESDRWLRNLKTDVLWRLAE